MATTLTLPVGGMSCAGCEHNIRFALSTLTGVERVHADHQAANVEVVYDPTQTDETALRSAIEDMATTSSTSAEPARYHDSASSRLTPVTSAQTSRPSETGPSSVLVP